MQPPPEIRQTKPSVRKNAPAATDLHPLLVEVGDALARGQSLDAVLDVLLRRVLELAGSQHGFIATLDPDGTSMGLRVAHGLFAARRLPHFAPSIGVFGRAWSDSEPLLIDDYETWSGRGLDMQAAGAHGLALVPLKVNGGVIGLLGVASTRPAPDSLDRATLDLLTTLAHLVTMVIGARGPVIAAPIAPSTTERPHRNGTARRDLTDRIFEKIPAVVMVKDRENRVVRANETAARMLDLPVAEVEGRYLWELDPESAAVSYRHDLEVIETGEPVLHRIEEQTDAAGSKHWWSVDRMPLLDDRGRVESIVVLGRDISEEHVDRSRLDASRRAAERADRIRNHTLATLAHDVRVPLERVHEIAERLLVAAAEGEFASDLADLRFAADSASTHVQDLLDFARMEAGNLPVESAPFDLRQLVEDVLELAWQSAHARGIVVAGHVDPSIPPYLHGDLVRVRQVLVQLVAQALRAVSGGEIVVSARTVLRSEHHWEVRLEVHASEWSHLPQELEEMFGPFLHGEDVLDESPRAGAVGLALAHRMVQMLGGRVGLQTASEGELSCWCALPFDRAPVDEAELVTSVRPRAGARVLLLEAHPSVARVIACQCRDLSAVVDVAHEGEAALAMIEQARADGWSFDLCLVGERIGDLDALEWIARLGEARHRPERVIHLVPFGRRWRREGDPLRGPDARVTQPVRAQRLAEVMAALVGHDEGSDSRPDRERVLADERIAAGMRVFVLEADPLQQRLLETGLRRLGCDVEAHSDPAIAVARLDQARPGEFALALVDPRLPLPGRRSLIEAIRHADARKGHRPLYALVDVDDRGLREKSLAAGVDGVAGRPPRFEDLRRLLARHAPAAAQPAVAVR